VGPIALTYARNAPPMAARSADRYFEWKSQIHPQADRRAQPGPRLIHPQRPGPRRDRPRGGAAARRRARPMTTPSRPKIVEEVLDEWLGLGPLETLAQRAQHFRHSGEPLRQGLHRAKRKALGDHGAVQGRRAPAATIIEKIVSQCGRRHRRGAADCRRALSGRIARHAIILRWR